jgi:hypothetical protein
VSQVPVVTDTGTFNTGLFEGFIVHGVTGMVFDDVDKVIDYLLTVSDDDYRVLRNSTEVHGAWLRNVPPSLVEAATNFFWEAFHDRDCQFAGSWWP